MTWPLRALAGSALVHGALVAAVLSMGSRSELPALFVDLTQEAPAPGRVVRPRDASPRAAKVSRPTGSLRRAREQPPPAPPPHVAPTPVREGAPEPIARTDDPAPEVERSDEIYFGGASESTPDRAASKAAGDGEGEAGATAGAPGPLSAPGSALATRGSIGGSGAGEREVEYGGYLSKLRESILKGVRYPASARRRGVAGTVQIELTIRPSGAIGTIVVVGSSSHEVLDRAAVESIQSLRLPPFPPDLRARELRVRLPVVFRLE